MGFLKKIFHKICYRIYMIGKNESIKKVNKLSGVSNISNLKNLTISNNVSFGGDVMILGAGSIEIGENSMIGASSIIHSSTHDYNLHPMNEKRIDKNTSIGKHVWIGTGVIVNPGVKIGDYSVVGSGSVVTKDVPKGTIVAGVPARKLKDRNINDLNLN